MNPQHLLNLSISSLLKLPPSPKGDMTPVVAQPPVSRKTRRREVLIFLIVASLKKQERPSGVLTASNLKCPVLG